MFLYHSGMLTKTELLADLYVYCCHITLSLYDER